MTDEENLTNVTNKNKEQETIESDIESVCSDDRSNATTDDEFYNELMAAPAETEDHLIADGCTDEIVGIEHLTLCLNRRYNSCPVVFTGTLKNAINESFNSKERRPLLIYINNDKSVYTNLFCKQLFCHEKIIEFLLNNYVLWAWDVTFPSNGEKLNEIYKKAFSQWNIDQNIGTKSIERYPLLLGLSRNRNGDYLFKHMIDGSEKRPALDEFLGQLIQHKDQFDDYEEEYEREKSKPRQMSNPIGTMDFHHLPKYPANQDFSRSNPFQFSPFLSNDNDLFSMQHRIYLPHAFRQMNIHPDDGDDENDDDDDDDDDDYDDGKTPTADHPHPLPKFPKH